MILFDGTHLITDHSIKELFAFASKVGLRQDWFQLGRHKFNPHFDVTSESMRKKVIENRALIVSPRRIVQELRNNREELVTQMIAWWFENSTTRSDKPHNEGKYPYLKENK